MGGSYGLSASVANPACTRTSCVPVAIALYSIGARRQKRSWHLRRRTSPDYGSALIGERPEPSMFRFLYFSHQFSMSFRFLQVHALQRIFSHLASSSLASYLFAHNGWRSKRLFIFVRYLHSVLVFHRLS